MRPSPAVPVIVVALAFGAALASSSARAAGAPAASQASPAPDPALGPALERARAAAQTLGGALLKALAAELQAGGPPQGIKACSEIAPRIAVEQSKDGLAIRRVTQRPRNPANAPDDWEKAGLEQLAAAHALAALPPELSEIVGPAKGPRTLRYLKPIVIAQACLACHGEPSALDPAVRRSLAERYPHDKATGYRAGDFRGAFSVSVSLPPAN
ncbi:MAG: DUF3365 domain-containing protein [Vicinamibacteria bacterium]